MEPNNLYRAGGLLIRDKKLLLITGGGEGTYWTPGGRLEEGEDPIDGLRREFREEIGLEIQKLEYFGTFRGEHRDFPGEIKRFGYWLVECEGEPFLAEEYITDIRWFSREDLDGPLVPSTHAIRERVIPILIERGLV